MSAFKFLAIALIFLSSIQSTLGVDEEKKHIEKTLPDDVEVVNPDDLKWDGKEPPIERDEAVIIEEPHGVKGRTSTPEKRIADVDKVGTMETVECYSVAGRKLNPAMRARRTQDFPDIDFKTKFQNYENKWPVMLVSVMPGEKNAVSLIDETAETFVAKAKGGSIEKTETHSWEWTAPKDPGMYCVRVDDTSSKQFMCFHAAVMTPYDGSSEVGEYKIGEYQKKPMKKNPNYKMPEGFIKVTKEIADTWVSPHFQLKQFLCKQKGSYPKYMLLQTHLIMKLELLLEELNNTGIDAESFYITSGFRTPYYNRSIGVKTTYSRHLYGDAADFYVDSNRDGKMDDINESGNVTGEDAVLMKKVTEQLTSRPQYEDLIGGLGLYSSSRYANPFLHVDTRGYRARWVQ